MFPANFGCSSLVILAIGLLSMRPLWASAQQTTDVVCLPQYHWMDNSKGQNPCLVKAYASGTCWDGQWTVKALPPDYYYLGPWTEYATPCDCSSVTYSLMAACSICQNRTFITWGWWSTNCSTVYPGVYPKDIQLGTAIPHWAYQNVLSTNLFNVTLAQLAGDAPESTATKLQSTVTAVTATATKLQSTAAAVTSTTLPASITFDATTGTFSPTSTSSASPSKSNTTAIVGGAVVGVVVLGAIASFVTWFCIRRRRQTRAPSAMYDGTAPTNTMYTATSPFTASATQPRPYDPSDPSTFTSPPSPTTHTSPSTGYQNNSIHSNIYAAQGGRPGAYSGVPEL